LAKGKPCVLAGVDIGTHRTKVAVVSAGERRPALMSAVALPSMGVEKGVIVDSAACAGVVGRAVGEAVRQAGVSLDGAWVSYSGSGTAVRECPEFLPFDEETSLCFYSSLKAVTAPKEHIESIEACACSAGLAVCGVLYSPLATARAALTPVEREAGTLLLEVGSWASTVSIFDGGSLKETAVVPVGGEHLLCDLAIGLRVPLVVAQEILYHIEEDSLCAKNLSFDLKLAHKILKSRLCEMGELFLKTYRGFSYPGLLPGGVVLCGGVSRLQELLNTLMEFFTMPVRCGEIKEVFGIKPGMEDFTCAVGLALSGLRYWRKSFRFKAALPNK